MSNLGIGWQLKLSLILVPAVTYLVMALSVSYPKTERVMSNVSTASMWKEATRPLFLLLLVCMWMTAAIEMGPDQWFPRVMGELVPQLSPEAGQRRAVSRLYRRPDVRAPHVGQQRDAQVAGRHHDRQLAAERDRPLLAGRARQQRRARSSR